MKTFSSRIGVLLAAAGSAVGLGSIWKFPVAVFTGWFVPQARYQGSRLASCIYLVLLRWIIPIAIIIVFLNSLNII